jgi:predicted branched-subunit amino acid permease
MIYHHVHNTTVPFAAGFSASLVTTLSSFSPVAVLQSVAAGLLVTLIWNAMRWAHDRLRKRWFRP